MNTETRKSSSQWADVWNKGVRNSERQVLQLTLSYWPYTLGLYHYKLTLLIYWFPERLFCCDAETPWELRCGNFLSWQPIGSEQFIAVFPACVVLVHSHRRGRDSSVTVVTRYGLNYGVRFPAGEGIFFSSPQHPDWLWGPPSLYLMDTGGCFLGVKRPGPEADYSPSSIAEVKKAWNYIWTPHTWRRVAWLSTRYVCIAWYLVKHRNITLP
jgi:hypothetical protein